VAALPPQQARRHVKALLLVRGDEDIVVINVPWYLSA
jgi:hypothetical protein